MQRLNVALIGAGRIGAAHARRLASIPECRLAVVVDHDRERARLVAEPLGAASSSDSLALINDPKIDAVAIATQVATHAELAIACAQAGKPFWIEKPLAHDLESARKVVEAVERSGVPAQVGFQRRWDPPYVEAKRRIEAGELGRPEVFRGVSRDPYPPPLEYLIGSGDILVDMGIHDFDSARFLVGEVARVQARGSALAVPELAEHGLVDTTVTLLEFENGALGTLEVALRTAYGYEIRAEVLGERGRVHIEIDRQPDLLVYDVRGGSFDRPRGFEDRFGRSYQLELEGFVRAIREGAPPYPDVREGYLSLKLAFAAQHSLTSGKPVDLDQYGPFIDSVDSRP